MCFFNNNFNRCCNCPNQCRRTRVTTPTNTRGPRGPQGPQGPQGPSGFDGIAYFNNATQTIAAGAPAILGTAALFPTTTNWITYTVGGNSVTLQPGLYKVTYTATAVSTDTAVNPALQLYLNGAPYAPSRSESQANTTGTLASTVVLQINTPTTLQLFNPTTSPYTLNNLNLTIEKINTTTPTAVTPTATSTVVYY